MAPSDVTLTSAKLKNDPVAGIQAVPPEGCTVVKVEENTYPAHRPEGKGKAVFLRRWETLPLVVGGSTTPGRTGANVVLVVVYVMPADYQDGVSPQQAPRTENPADLIATASSGKV